MLWNAVLNQSPRVRVYKITTNKHKWKSDYSKPIQNIWRKEGVENGDEERIVSKRANTF